jgi:hypothetical protein
LSSIELDSARESGDDEIDLAEDDFEEGQRNVISAFVRGGATPVAPSAINDPAAAEQTSLLRNRRKDDADDGDNAP